MIKYAKLECTVNEYDDLQKVQRANKNPLKEQFIGSRRKLYNSNKMIGTISSFKNLELGALINNYLGNLQKIQIYIIFI